MAEVKCDCVLEESDDHCSLISAGIAVPTARVGFGVANRACLSRLSLPRVMCHTALPENLGEHGRHGLFALDPTHLFLQQASTFHSEPPAPFSSTIPIRTLSYPVLVVPMMFVPRPCRTGGCVG